MPLRAVWGWWAILAAHWRSNLDPARAADYRQRNVEYIRGLCLWLCALGFVFHTAAFIVWVVWYALTGRDVAIMASFILPTVLILSVMVISRCFPGVQDYHLAAAICAIGIVFVAWVMCAMHINVTIGTDYDIKQLIPNVWASVQGSPPLKDELDTYVRLQNTRKSTWSVLLLLVLEFSFLPLIGFTRSVALVYLSIPVGLFVTSAISREMVGQVNDLCLVSLIEVLYTLIISRYITKLRQQDFQLGLDLQEAKVNELLANQTALEAERAKEATEAARAADSLLHHILKNAMVDARGCIDLYVQSQCQEGDLLSKAVECLTHGMKWCQSRQALTRIVQGRYSPQLTPVDLVEFGAGLAQGRRLRSTVSPGTVMLDPTLCSIMLINAISNAFKHGNETDPDVQLHIKLHPGPVSCARELVMEVSNRADPRKPVVCAELLERLVGPSTELSVLTPNRKQFSDHIGLEHIFMAAHAHSMDATLSQEGDVVVFRVRMTVLDLSTPPGPECESPLQCPTPRTPLPGLRYYCLDDSPIARKVLQHNLTAYAAPAKVCTLGATPLEVQRFAALALCDADVVILDQYLEYDGDMYYGTAVAEELRRRDFKGLICIRSANASPDDEEVYRRHGAHCVIGKDVRPQQMVLQLHAAYLEHTRTFSVITLSLPEHCPNSLHTSPLSSPRSPHSVADQQRPTPTYVSPVNRGESGRGTALPGALQPSTSRDALLPRLAVGYR